MHESFAPKSTLLEERQMSRILRRMAGEVAERFGELEDLVLVGIRTRGVPLAERLAALLEELEGRPVALGTLDITLYRDDLSTIAPQPVVKQSRIEVPIEGRVVVLCDDVLFTGRTVRAALDALQDYGRPRAVRLVVLVDRGLRELPVQADVVGTRVETTPDELVEVTFRETDDSERVRVLERARAERPGSGRGNS